MSEPRGRPFTAASLMVRIAAVAGGAEPGTTPSAGGWE